MLRVRGTWGTRTQAANCSVTHGVIAAVNPPSLNPAWEPLPAGPPLCAHQPSPHAAAWPSHLGAAGGRAGGGDLHPSLHPSRGGCTPGPASQGWGPTRGRSGSPFPFACITLQRSIPGSISTKSLSHLPRPLPAAF